MRRKRSKSNNPKADNSRLAALPDDVLFLIASYLGTEEASKTIFALSKRFRNLWNSVPMLELDGSSFYYSSTFATFVNKLLSFHRRTTTIKTLVFDSPTSRNTRLFDRVARFVISHGVQHLTFIAGRSRHSLPTLSRSFSMLTTLTLQVKLIINEPLSLPHVTTLHLEDLCFECENIFSNCPNLRDATLIDFNATASSGKCYLTAPALEKLTLELAQFYNCLLSISAPRLSSLNIKGAAQMPLMFDGKLFYLRTVTMDFVGRIRYFQAQEKEKLLEDVNNMLQSFGYAEDISMNHGAVELISEAARLRFLDPSMFFNIKTLALQVTPFRYPEDPLTMSGILMTYFLRNSPNARVAIAPLSCIIDNRRRRRAMA